jgi:hypothetical protein
MFFLVLIGPGPVMVDAHGGGAIGHTGVALASRRWSRRHVSI